MDKKQKHKILTNKKLWILISLFSGWIRKEIMRFLLAFLFLISGCYAQNWREPDWSKHIAAERGLDPKVACEVRTPDGSRADIVDDIYAWEVEWAYKWKEAPAQATFYAMALNRKPAVMLLVKDRAIEKDEYLRCLAVCKVLKYNDEPIHLEVYFVRSK